MLFVHFHNVFCNEHCSFQQGFSLVSLTHTSCCPFVCRPLESHKAINWTSFTLIKGQLFAADSLALPTGDVLLVAADGGMCWLMNWAAYCRQKPSLHYYINQLHHRPDRNTLCKISFVLLKKS